MHVTILEIPRETRDAILEMVLLTCSVKAITDTASAIHGLCQEKEEAYQTHGHGRPRLPVAPRYRCDGFHFLESRCFMSTCSNSQTANLPVFYTPVRNPALPLLMVNRQVHDETLDVLARQTDPPVYSAHIMFVKNVGLFTTWLCAPRLATRLDAVHVDFHIRNAPQARETPCFKENMWREDAGRPPVGIWGFLDLLIGFLDAKIGPWPKGTQLEPVLRDGRVQPRGGSGSDEGGITVNQLVFNVLSATENDVLPLDAAGKSRMPFLAQKETDLEPPTSEQKGAALLFARFLGLIFHRLESPRPDTLDYSRYVFERLGDIQIRVDGALYENLDLPGTFARLSWDHLGNLGAHQMEWRENMYAWKRRAEHMRWRAGFRMVRPSRRMAIDGWEMG